MSKFNILATLLAVFFVTGCQTQHYYAPIMYNNNASYMAKPLSSEEKKSINYLSAGISTATGVDFNSLNDESYHFQFDAHRANTYNNINLAYGVFGFAGAYQNGSLKSGDANYFDTKSFAGIGAKFSADIYTPVSDKVDFRVIGAEFSYSNEYGEFANFRNTARNNINFHTDNNNQVISAGLTSEVAWRGKHNSELIYAVRGYAGTIVGNHGFSGSDYRNQFGDRINLSASFFMKIKRYYLVIDKQQLINTTLRVGYSF